jgi:hypothetical protein
MRAEPRLLLHHLRILARIRRRRERAMHRHLHKLLHIPPMKMLSLPRRVALSSGNSGSQLLWQNSCTLLLKNERAETSEKIRKLDWALLLERSAHKRLKENPLGHQLGPTREEVQERLAKERERAARWEHKRQAAIEQDLRRKLAEKIERERDPERRAKEEAAAERAKSKGTALATALAVARGRSGLTDF